MLHVNDLSYRIEGRVLFDQATAAISAGWKVGFVGRNGTGKSTLLRMIKGEFYAGEEEISLQKGARLGSVDQEAPASAQSLMETVLEQDAERAALFAETETATDPHRIAEIQTRLADIDAHSAEARAGAILSGLGFSAADQKRPCAEFSGGWRMRVALAGVLFSAPDLLLLDEPTNYLDLEGAVWLETYLKRYPYTALIVSHDRDLLNKAVTHIMALENGKLTVHPGGYDTYERKRAEARAQAASSARVRKRGGVTCSPSSIAFAPRRQKRNRRKAVSKRSKNFRPLRSRFRNAPSPFIFRTRAPWRRRSSASLTPILAMKKESRSCAK